MATPCLGPLTGGVLGEFTREHEADSGLDFVAREGGYLVVRRKLASFHSDALKDVIDDRVNDGHALLGDPRIRMDLLEHLVDLRGIRLRALLLLAGRHLLVKCVLGRLLGWGLDRLGNYRRRTRNK
jgi:hypothetical protein